MNQVRLGMQSSPIDIVADSHFGRWQFQQCFDRLGIGMAHVTGRDDSEYDLTRRCTIDQAAQLVEQNSQPTPPDE